MKMLTVSPDSDVCSAVLLWVFLAISLGLLPATIHAAAQFDLIDVSPDTTVVLGGQLIADENLARDNLQGSVLSKTVTLLPPGTGITAYHQLEDGASLFCIDTKVKFDSGLFAVPADIIRLQDGELSLEFSGAAVGVAPGAKIDALSVHENGNLLVSFNVTVTLNGLTFSDEDLAQYNGAEFSLFFDGSAAAIDTSLDLDAAHYLERSGILLLSFSGGGEIDGVNFSDEDLLAFDAATASWVIAYDGSAQHSAWVGADLDAAYASIISDLIFLNGFE